MQAHSEHVTQLMADRPEIAFYAPNCREHGIGMGETVTVREQETAVNEISQYSLVISTSKRAYFLNIAKFC